MNEQQVQSPGSGATAVPPEGLSPEPGLIDRGMDLLAAGGPVVGILIAMSVAALAIVLVKLWQFHAMRIGDRRTAREGLQIHRGGRTDVALSRLAGSGSPVARVLALALRGHQRGLPEAKVREEVVRVGDNFLEALRSWLRPLEVIASLAPLLGLFGTVLGMIEAFRQMEQAGNQVNPAVLSGGIWEALLTTAVGLAVAIPVVAILNWLERRVDRLAQEMDDVVTQVFTEDLSGPTEESAHHEPARFRPAGAAAAGE